VRALRKLTYLPFILTAIAILAACLWVALPHEEKENQVNPVEMTAPAKITVYIPHNENVRRCENGFVYLDEIPLSDGWQCFTQEMCNKYGLDYPLVLGLMETESSFRDDADSGWAYGLCQIGYINEEELSALGMDIYTNEGNIEAGCYLLSDLMTRHSVSESLMAYNMGEFGAEEFWAQGITESQYSRDVLAAAQRWEERLR
jgi:hypothetical protein